MDADENRWGKESTSYNVWRVDKKIEEMHLTDLCKILINC